jgi:hypothetical protein
MAKYGYDDKNNPSAETNDPRGIDKTRSTKKPSTKKPAIKHSAAKAVVKQESKDAPVVKGKSMPKGKAQQSMKSKDAK